MRHGPWIVAGALLLGCAQGGGWGTESGSGLVEKLATSLEVGVTPEAVRLILHVTNAGDRPVELTFPTSQRYDFEVESGGGERIWRWSDGRAFLQVVTEAVLEPGETWTMEGEWDAAGRSGRHVAVARLVGSASEVEERTEFVLP